MKSNTAIILILRDHMIPYEVVKGVVKVNVKDCALVTPETKTMENAFISVPDIVSAMWVVGA